MDLDFSGLAKQLGYGKIQCFFDAELDLACVIALHSTALGPAIGGCRFVEYGHFNDAVIDALKLGQAMSLKAAIHGLNHGGGKAVIMKPKNIKNRAAIFKKFGEFVDDFKGDYITAIDSGTSDNDMETIAQSTKNVLNPSKFDHRCDPSNFTAKGVFFAIKATAQHLFNTDDLSGLTMIVQGLGHVGFPLALKLIDAGVKVLVTDCDTEKALQFTREHKAKFIEPDNWLSSPCDLLVPCALGGVLSHETLPLVKAAGVVGSANNIFLDNDQDSLAAHQQGLICVPDYVSNGGGLIHVAGLHSQQSTDATAAKIAHIRENVLQILTVAKTQDRPPLMIANSIAQQRINLDNDQS